MQYYDTFLQKGAIFLVKCHIFYTLSFLLETNFTRGSVQKKNDKKGTGGGLLFYTLKNHSSGLIDERLSWFYDIFIVMFYENAKGILKVN